MPQPAKRVTSIIAAALLSAVTLTTFFVLRNYGPENAIERFHNAAFEGDQLEVGRVCLQPPNSLAVRALATEVYNLRRAGAVPDVQDVQRSPRQVVVWIAYRLPGEVNEIRWVVVLGPASTWLIDAKASVESSKWGF